MREPTIATVLAALKAHGPAASAAAIYADNDPAFIARLVDALISATTDLATYPHADVIAEADALLYQTLCDPIADAVPTAFIDVDPGAVVDHQVISEDETASRIDRLHRTDADAARLLVARGPQSWWTIEQHQVATCIHELIDTGITPTRRTVADHATARARQAMRSHHGTEPFMHSSDPDLGPRILSPSPMALVPGWIRRMDASPPPLDLAQNRIAYLRAAMSAMGQAAVAANRLAAVPTMWIRPERAPRPSLTLA
jgi:hypothetical protein